jgi:hypothetical protein
MPWIPSEAMGIIDMTTSIRVSLDMGNTPVPKANTEIAWLKSRSRLNERVVGIRRDGTRGWSTVCSGGPSHDDTIIECLLLIFSDVYKNSIPSCIIASWVVRKVSHDVYPTYGHLPRWSTQENTNFRKSSKTLHFHLSKTDGIERQEEIPRGDHTGFIRRPGGSLGQEVKNCGRQRQGCLQVPHGTRQPVSPLRRVARGGSTRIDPKFPARNPSTAGRDHRWQAIPQHVMLPPTMSALPERRDREPFSQRRSRGTNRRHTTGN